jgi:hypothetical protein
MLKKLSRIATKLSLKNLHFMLNSYKNRVNKIKENFQKSKPSLRPLRGFLGPIVKKNISSLGHRNF